MRGVKPGDIILHLTDNRGFTGLSIAAEAADDTFGGIAGTEWYGDCYRIALRDYVEFSPPLLRDQLLKTEPYATELRELIESGVKGLFYNAKLDLNQGAYLTKATPTLLSILNRAYVEVAGKPLPLIGKDEALEPEASGPDESYSIEDALKTLFLDRQELEEILFLWKAKKKHNTSRATRCRQIIRGRKACFCASRGSSTRPHRSCTISPKLLLRGFCRRL